MSTTVTTDIFCDGKGCMMWTDGFSGTRPNAKKARELARSMGWRYIEGKDYCADCARKLPPKKKPV